MRWRVDLSYQGTNYSGWQKQPGDKTVQQTLEEAFSMILREPVEIIGCGRTDAGVHARKYTSHLDLIGEHDISKTLYQVNAVLPEDIAVNSIRVVHSDFHARYNAIKRQYKYYLHFSKDPFLQYQSYYFHLNTDLNKTAMLDAARALLSYEEFLPFCKTGSDANHYKCHLTESSWAFSDDKAVFTITANRFLRGMVRLIVGSMLNVGLEKLSPDTIRLCLEDQAPTPVQWSVPPEGLFLENVLYPED